MVQDSTKLAVAPPQDFTSQGFHFNDSNPSNTITSDQLQPATPITLPPLTPPAGNPDGTVAGAGAVSKSAADYIAAATPPETALDTQYKGILDSIASMTGDLGNKGADTLALQKQNDVAAKQQSVQDLNNQLNAESAAYNAQYANSDVSKGDISAPIVTGQQAALQRSHAAKVGMLSAQLSAAQGNLSLANQQVSNAIDLKYSTIEAELATKKAQLDALTPSLNKQDAIQAKALDRQYTEQQQAIADKKDQEKQISQIMIQAAQSGADGNTLQEIQNSQSVQQAVALAGDALGADFKQKMAQQAFDNKIKLQQVAISGGQLAVSQANLQLAKTKEAFDEAMKLNPGGTATQPMQQATTKANIDLITSLTTDKGLNSAVGPNYLARLSVVNQLSGSKSNFIAGVEQLTSQLSLDSLIKAKSEGATFGALSEGEMKILSASATKIGSWAIKKDGNITGFNASEKDFRAELDKINNFAKLDYVLKGGNPDDVNIKQEPDGTWSTRNSDGSITNLGK